MFFVAVAEIKKSTAMYLEVMGRHCRQGGVSLELARRSGSEKTFAVRPCRIGH